MKLKIISAISILICLSAVSCRENEELITDNFKSETSVMEGTTSEKVYSRDSSIVMPTIGNEPDPPKTGHQWKTIK